MLTDYNIHPISINTRVLHSSLSVLKLDSSFDYNLLGGRLLFRSGYLLVVCSIVPGCSCGGSVGTCRGGGGGSGCTGCGGGFATGGR